MFKNYLKIMKCTRPYIPEAQRTPSKINYKQTDTLVQLLKMKDKGKIITVTRGEKDKFHIENKDNNYSLRYYAMLKTKWHLQILKTKHLSPETSIPSKSIFKKLRRNKDFLRLTKAERLHYHQTHNIRKY